MSLLEEIRATRVNNLWCMIAIDEAPHIRNSNTEINKLVHLLSYISEMMIMLSVIPLNHKDTDLFNQINILNRGNVSRLFNNSSSDFSSKVNK